MRRMLWILALIILLGMDGTSRAGEVAVQTGLGYSGWHSDEDESGSQFFVPINVSGTYGDVTFHALATYVHSSLDIPDAGRQSVSGLIDTKVGATYEIVDKLPVDFLFGLDLNLPTGEEGMSTDKLAVIRDADLLAISTLGEGFNINPTLTIAREVKQWAFGIGFGYAWRGEYDYSASVTGYDPGDIFNIVLEGNWNLNDQWRLRLFGERAWYQTNERDGEAYSKNGGFTLLGLAAEYERDNWGLSISATPVFREKSSYITGSQALATEDHNSHGDEWNLAVMGNYGLNPKTQITAGLDVLYIQANGYPQDSSYFKDQRMKYGLKAGLSRVFGADFVGALELSGFMMEEDQAWYLGSDGRSYYGYALLLIVGKQF